MDSNLLSIARGAVLRQVKPDGENVQEQLRNALDDNSLGLADIAQNLKRIAYCAEREETQLRANELALKLHGAMHDKVSTPSITIRVEGDLTANTILIPQIGA